MARLGFTEQTRQVFLHDYLLYCCGVDITQFCQSVEVTYSDRNGPSSLTVTLLNPFDQWIMTTANLAAKQYRITDDRYSEAAKRAIYNRKKALSARTVIRRKYPLNPRSESFGAEDPLLLKKLQGKIDNDFNERYSFGPGTCVFSRFDTVKMFLKNPSDTSESNRWLPFFTGTLGSHPFRTNYITGASSITLMAYDIRSVMAGMRVAVNPFTNQSYKTTGTLAANQRAQQTFFDSDEAGFFKDFYPGFDGTRAKPFDNIFAGLSFVDAVSLITTGRTGWASPAGVTPLTEGLAGVKSGPGVGNFTPGQIIKYGPKSNSKVTEKGIQNSLENWDQLCLFGMDPATNKIRAGYLTEKQCRGIGSQSFWTQDFAPLEGQVHFLLPAEGLQITDIVRSSTNGMSEIMASPDWQDRQSLVASICNQVDYEWSVTSSGDIVFEFPMYDFFPSDFGRHSAIYVINGHVQDDQISDEEGDIPAALESTGTSFQLALSGAQASYASAAPGTAVNPFKCVVKSDILAAKYGAKVQHVTFTGINTQRALAKLTGIEHQKRIMRANRLSFNFSYRPWLRPNRPLLHETRNRLGKITSVTVSLPVYTQTPTTRASIDSVRLPLLVTVKNKTTIVYQHITGADSAPLSYNAIFEPPDTIGNPVGNPDKGSSIIDATNSPPKK